jgi:hypothetical protein
MTLPRSRIPTAVPQMWQTHLEIAKAVRRLAAQESGEQLQCRAEVHGYFDPGSIDKIVRELWREMRKAGFNPDEPRVPAGQTEGGRWTKQGMGDANAATAEIAGVGHNQGPPLNEPPEVPPEVPLTAKARNAFLKAAARWLIRASLEATLGGPVGDYLVALEAAYWLYQYLPYIRAYLQPPKTWAELQEDALSPQKGYDIHHPVEQTPAEQDGFSPDEIDASENRLRIPTLKHWEITAWYATRREDFGGLSPRDYLRGKSWEERVRVAKIAMIRFGVLKP